MTIYHHIKHENGGRYVVGNTWIYFDFFSQKWYCLHRPYAAKKNRILYAGPSEPAAVAALRKEENES